MDELAIWGSDSATPTLGTVKWQNSRAANTLSQCLEVELQISMDEGGVSCET